MHKNITKEKHKNANKRTKIKNAFKKHLGGKSHLFTYLRRNVSTIEILIQLN